MDNTYKCCVIRLYNLNEDQIIKEYFINSGKIEGLLTLCDSVVYRPFWTTNWNYVMYIDGKRIKYKHQ